MKIYILVEKWLNGIFSNDLQLTLVMPGKVDYNEYLDKVIESGKNNTVEFSRLEMIVDIYGEELKPSYKKIIDARSELNEISLQHKRAYKSGDIDGKRFLKPFTDAQVKLVELTAAFKKEIAEHAKRT